MRFSLNLPNLLVLSLLTIAPTTFASQDDQIAMTGPSAPQGEVYTPLTHSKPTLADLLTIEPSASIFYSYARELELSRVFGDDSESAKKITVLVPTNKAVMALARKPHQDPVPVDEGVIISEEEFEARSKKNVERWVQAHIIPQSPITLDQTYQTLLEKKSVTFTPITKNDGRGPEWSRVTVEDGVRITSAKEGLNGVLYLIDGTVSLD
ncbi:hypothetical protein AX16_007639 [Volvariella volvacea WC 439]|nr:hypothetical protein AX16_007639 [Volvariella volvacea WC 439]